MEASRLAQAAVNALVSAEAYGRMPILADHTRQLRSEAEAALKAALRAIRKDARS